MLITPGCHVAPIRNKLLHDVAALRLLPLIAIPVLFCCWLTLPRLLVLDVTLLEHLAQTLALVDLNLVSSGPPWFFYYVGWQCAYFFKKQS
jgi:hypothetical protein